MNSNMKNLIKLSGVLSISIFIIMVTIKKPSIGVEYLSIISQSIGNTSIIIFIFEKWLWRIFPFIRTPRLKKEYTGILTYNFNGDKFTKEIQVFINQTYTTTIVKLKTNEVTSNSITAEIIKENEDYILYYNYKTMPYSEYSDANPIQVGTCRLDISDLENISGIYWTNRKTIGDIRLY